MKKPLEFCCNGDGRPVQPPSWVLCKECFAKLDAQFQQLRDALPSAVSPPAPERAER